MLCYSLEPRYQVFVKSYGFLSFDINMSTNIGKNISKNLSQNLLDYPKQSATNAENCFKKSN